MSRVRQQLNYSNLNRRHTLCLFIINTNYKTNESPPSFPAQIQIGDAPLLDMTKMNEIHGDILMQALGQLDGQSLASATCASSHLRSLASHPDLWRHLCLSTWPSLNHPLLLPLLNSSPRLFFSDAHTFPASSSPTDNTDLPGKLISAVDLYDRGNPIFSCVIETDTSTSWFRNSAFLIDAPSAAGVVSPKDLTLSWIVIDPAKGRAVNLSSRMAVAVEKRDWCVGETVARFATVRDGSAVSAVVMWRKGREEVMEVTLMVEDMDGVCVSGKEGLRVVKAATEAERKGMGEDKAKERYLEYVKMKRSREERRDKRFCFGDICLAAVAVVASLAFLSLYFLR